MYIDQKFIKYIIQVIFLFIIGNNSYTHNIHVRDDSYMIDVMTDNSIFSILHVAVLTKDIELLMYLLNTQKMNINTKDLNGCTALHIAVIAKDISFVEILIRLGADINSFNNLGETPLSKSVQNRTHDISTYLIQQGADIDIYNNIGQSLDEIAELYQNQVYIKYIKYLRNSENKYNQNLLLY